LELATEGRHLGGATVPLGYSYDSSTKKLSVVPSEAKIVRRIFKSYEGGSSLREIARDLEQHNVIGKLGRKTWGHGGVNNILDNPTYAGYRHHNGELTKGDWRPLISEETWQRVKALRTASRAATPSQNRAGKGSAMLSGLLFCPCGEPMWKETYGSAYEDRSSYLCRRAAKKRWGDCEKGGISAPRAERISAEQFLERVTGPYARYVQDKPKGAFTDDINVDDDLDARLHKIEKQMERLVELSIDQTGPLAAKKFREKAQKLEIERASLEREHAQRVASGITIKRKTTDIEQLRRHVADLPRVWEKATAQERNQMLKIAIDRIDVIGTGRPKNLSFTWADWLTS
jgi:hypothetical protein